MERSRSAALALSDTLDHPDLGLRTVAPLSECLETLRSVGRTREDVTSFVEGLTLPLAEGETPRHRADVLLDVLEDEDLSGLTTHEGFPVGPAALEALQSLGFPYALEITPEMLVHAHQGERAGKPIPGTAKGVALALLSALPAVLASLNTSNPFVSGGSVLLVAPALAAALSRVLGGRLAHRLFNSLQWMVAGPLLFFLTLPLLTHLWEIGRWRWEQGWDGDWGGMGRFPMEFLVMGAMLLSALGSAWCLRRGPR